MSDGADTAPVCVAGIGRMGKGIALSFACAGYRVALLDSEERSSDAFAVLRGASAEELRQELALFEGLGVIAAGQAPAIAGRIGILEKHAAAETCARAAFAFEAVTEVLEVKRAVYDWLNRLLPGECIIASTTSTILADDLAAFVDIPERFLNAHWLNPAPLMPLVEVSPARTSGPEHTRALRALLESIGKKTILCRPSPGYVVSRIQALALNEAARLVAEGVASAADVDAAVAYGLGLRYANFGLLEFIDFGGGDILYYASRYLAEKLDSQRFAPAAIVAENMHAQRNGLRDGEGFYDWHGQDTEAFRRARLAELVRLLRLRDLLPRIQEPG